MNNISPFPGSIPSPWDPLVKTRVAGITFDNADGTSRQQAARLVKKDDGLALCREPNNPFDPNAIAVVWKDTEDAPQQIGYVPRGLALLLAPLMDAGAQLGARVVRRAEVFRREDRGRPVVGVRMEIVGNLIGLDPQHRTGLEPSLTRAAATPSPDPDPGDAPGLPPR